MTDDGYRERGPGLFDRLVRRVLGNLPALIGLAIGIVNGRDFAHATTLPPHEFGSPSAMLAIWTFGGAGVALLIGLLLLISERTSGLGQVLLIALGAAAVGWLATVLILPR